MCLYVRPSELRHPAMRKPIRSTGCEKCATLHNSGNDTTININNNNKKKKKNSLVALENKKRECARGKRSVYRAVRADSICGMELVGLRRTALSLVIPAGDSPAQSKSV